MEQPEQKIENLERRVKRLELFSHPPVNWEQKIKSLEDSIIKLYNLIKGKEK